MKGEIRFRPYGDEARDLLYNLLFCDDYELFRPKDGEAKGVLGDVLALRPDVDALRRISQDEDEESRVRALAFDRLRELRLVVPSHILLGTIVEVAMPEGLDALAAYADGRVRYLNHAGAPAILESAPPSVTSKCDAVIEASRDVVSKIGPWGKPRLAPPQKDHVRLTFLVSDGLYFGEGPFSALAQDPMSAPLIKAAGELLGAVADAVLKK